MQRSNHHAHSLSRSIGGWFGTGLMGSTLLIISPAAAANALSAWQFDPATRQFTVTLPQGIAPRVVVVAEPARIILEIPQTRLGQVATEASYDGAVRSIRLVETEGNTLQVVLELAPGTVLSPNHAQLISVSTADQTRWVLTPLVAEAGTLATETGAGYTDALSTLPPAAAGQLPNPGSGANGETSEDLVAVPSLPLSAINAEEPLAPPPEVEASPAQPEPAFPTSTPNMVVELPVIPAAEPGLGFPEAGQGRLSTTAANLMLPSDVDDLENLPDTLPIDPFSIGMAETEQVTVPGLDELDAVTGPVATVPSLPAVEAEGAISEAAADPITDPTVGEPIDVITPEGNVPLPDAEPQNGDAVAPSEIASTPENLQPITVAPPSASPSAESLPDTAEVTPAIPEPAAVAGADEFQTVATSSNSEPGETAIAPAQEENGVVAVDPLPTAQGQPNAVISQAPPAAASAPVVDSPAVAEMPPSQDLLVVPELPTTTATGPVVPPTNIPASEIVVAASEPINFGQPLPGTTEIAVLNPTEPRAVPPANQEIPPDILIAAGTVLELRYPGNEPLVLEPGTNLNEVMLLESAILDPITQGVLAPRGSQLIGRFEPNGTNQQWVSEMIIVPAGQRVPLASTSETLIGSPQIESGRLAIGSGAGALALALLTGFSGIGLIGGAIVGATTMVGTSPQQVVIEPNQIIAVQVTENVPRSMPIAAGPDLSREWGAE
jgi:hypothetical protein